MHEMSKKYALPIYMHVSHLFQPNTPFTPTPMLHSEEVVFIEGANRSIIW